jgi:predicted site-specific integrase-resolvase
VTTPTPQDRHIPELLTLKDAADKIGISRQALHKAASKGQVRGALLGQGVWVFRKVVIEREAAERAAKKKPPAAETAEG